MRSNHPNGKHDRACAKSEIVRTTCASSPLGTSSSLKPVFRGLVEALQAARLFSSLLGTSSSFKPDFCGLLEALQTASVFDQGGTWGCGCSEGFIEAALEREALVQSRQFKKFLKCMCDHSAFTRAVTEKIHILRGALASLNTCTCKNKTDPCFSLHQQHNHKAVNGCFMNLHFFFPSLKVAISIITAFAFAVVECIAISITAAFTVAVIGFIAGDAHVSVVARAFCARFVLVDGTACTHGAA